MQIQNNSTPYGYLSMMLQTEHVYRIRKQFPSKYNYSTVRVRAAKLPGHYYIPRNSFFLSFFLSLCLSFFRLPRKFPRAKTHQTLQKCPAPCQIYLIPRTCQYSSLGGGHNKCLNSKMMTDNRSKFQMSST